jgi:hypothetical protein
MRCGVCFRADPNGCVVACTENVISMFLIFALFLIKRHIHCTTIRNRFQVRCGRGRFTILIFGGVVRRWSGRVPAAPLCGRGRPAPTGNVKRQACRAGWLAGFWGRLQDRRGTAERLARF